MLSPRDVVAEVNHVVRALVEVGLAGDQNFGFQRGLGGGLVDVTLPGWEYSAIALKARPYVAIYDTLSCTRCYNARLPDGALALMMYRFRGRALEQHRLAYFPSPHTSRMLESLDAGGGGDNLEGLEGILSREVLPAPLRFDYDARASVSSEVAHPRSHLTLGQYEGCRIPVSSPVTPRCFVDFLVRNFYSNDWSEFRATAGPPGASFEESILATERTVVHVVIPGAPVL